MITMDKRLCASDTYSETLPDMGLPRKFFHLLIVITLLVWPLASPSAPVRCAHDAAPIVAWSMAQHYHQGNGTPSTDGRHRSPIDCHSRGEQGCKNHCPVSSGCTEGCGAATAIGIVPSGHAVNWSPDRLHGHVRDILVYSHVEPPPVPPPIDTSS